MKDMIDWLQYLLSGENTKLYLILALLTTLMVIDFVVGSYIALKSPDKQFSSFKMKMGIMVKIVEILLAMIAVPFVLAFGGEFGLAGLWLAYAGLCFAEFWSIIGHLKLVDDGKGLHLLEALYKNIFNRGGNDGTK